MLVDHELIERTNVGFPIAGEGVIDSEQLHIEDRIREDTMSCAQNTFERGTVGKDGVVGVEGAEAEYEFLHIVDWSLDGGEEGFEMRKPTIALGKDRGVRSGEVIEIGITEDNRSVGLKVVTKVGK